MCCRGPPSAPLPTSHGEGDGGGRPLGGSRQRVGSKEGSKGGVAQPALFNDRGEKLCKLCQQYLELSSWGKKKFCTLCMRNYEAAERRAKSQKQTAMWADLITDLDLLRHFLQEFEKVVGPSRGSGNPRGGMRNCERVMSECH